MAVWRMSVRAMHGHSFDVGKSWPISFEAQGRHGGDFQIENPSSSDPSMNLQNMSKTRVIHDMDKHITEQLSMDNIP